MGNRLVKVAAEIDLHRTIAQIVARACIQNEK